MPWLEEHREIDGVEHVWLGGGWMAVPYLKNIRWNIQLDDGKPDPSKGGTFILGRAGAPVAAHALVEKLSP